MIMISDLFYLYFLLIFWDILYFILEDWALIRQYGLHETDGPHSELGWEDGSKPHFIQGHTQVVPMDASSGHFE